MKAEASIRQVVRPLFKTCFSLERIVGRILQEERGLRIAQFRTLMALRHHPGISQRRIAEYWGIAEASVSRQLKILIDKGFVREDPNPENRREHQLRLSAKGEKEVEEALRIADRKLEELFKTITNDTRQDLIRSLTAILNIIEQA